MVKTGWTRLTVRRAVVGLAIAASTLLPSSVLAEPSSPAAGAVRQPTATPSAESEYDRGVRARLAKDWNAAVEAFRGAVAMRPAFPEAWNELGFALRNQGRYPDSLQAYDEALRLRPNYPEALEYLGEAYVHLGRLDDARRILDRLRPLDKARAQELAEVIQKGQ
jgi:cytochrome c-type biogenesis protein CcmH/NrfG